MLEITGVSFTETIFISKLNIAGRYIILVKVFVHASTTYTAGGSAVSSNGANRPTQRPLVRNVWPCYWLSNSEAKTRRVISQVWARARLSPGYQTSASVLWPAGPPRRRICLRCLSPWCLHATGHASYWRWIATFRTMFWRSALECRQTGLFGPRCRFAAVKAPKLSDRAGPTRDRLEDYNM